MCIHSQYLRVRRRRKQGGWRYSLIKSDANEPPWEAPRQKTTLEQQRNEEQPTLLFVFHCTNGAPHRVSLCGVHVFKATTRRDTSGHTAQIKYKRLLQRVLICVFSYILVSSCSPFRLSVLDPNSLQQYGRQEHLLRVAALGSGEFSCVW